MPHARAEMAVEITELTKTHGAGVALAGVTLAIASGEVLALLGPNGAGKSTVVNVLTTMMRPTSGQARILGRDVVREAAEVRRSLGVVFQTPLVEGALRVQDVLDLQGIAHGMGRNERRRQSAAVLDAVGMTDRRHARISTLSGGMRRRVELARAVVHRPVVLVLDEPTAGLDPVARAAVWDYIGQLHREQKLTIILTTHQLDEAERCDRVAVMDAGQLVALDTPEALRAMVGVDEIILTVDDPAATVLELRRLGMDGEVVGDAVVVRTPDGASVAPGICRSLPQPVRSIRIEKPTLNHVFARLVDSERHA